MIIKNEQKLAETREHMRGGDGTVVLNAILKGDALPKNCRLFSEIVLQPGCSIGDHPHENECELFYVLEGTAVYNDNGTVVTAGPGEALCCDHGQTHAIRNAGDCTLKLLAVIITRV